MAFHAKSSKSKRASLWLAQQRLFLGITNANGTLEVDSVEWNPNALDLQTIEAAQLLTEALQKLSKQHGLSRLGIRLCLDDSLCVTRVVTGDPESQPALHLAGTG
jgi:hypothetical protein